MEAGIGMNILPTLAAVAAPATPAAVVGLNVYGSLVDINAPVSIAIPIAALAALGLELTGAALCGVAVTAWRRRMRVHAMIAIVGAVLYGGVAVWAILAVPTAAIFAPFPALSLLAYVGLALSGDVQRAHTEAVTQGEAEVLAIRAHTEELKAQTALVRANAKAHQAQVAPIAVQVRRGWPRACARCGAQVASPAHAGAHARHGHCQKT
jgi:hypothetical protein